MLLFANKARSFLTGSVTSAAGQVAAITTTSGALFVGVGGVATSTANPMRCVLTAVDANGNDTGAFEIVEVVRSGDNLTLQSRGLEGTSAAAWASGTVIECRQTAGVAAGAHEQTIVQRSGLLAQAGTNAFVIMMAGGAALTFPAGFFSVGDMLRTRAIYTKSGTANSVSVDLQTIDNGNNMGITPFYVMPASGNFMELEVTFFFDSTSHATFSMKNPLSTGSTAVNGGGGQIPASVLDALTFQHVAKWLAGDTVSLVQYNFTVARGV